MEKSTLNNKDSLVYQEIMTKVQIGHLALVDANSFPRLIPVNFVLYEDKVYFHGADKGEKYELFQKEPKVSFSAELIYSALPSYWFAKDYACKANIYFKSVHVRGQGKIIAKSEDKVAPLEALMKKDQPEGGYKTISYSDSLYKKALEEVAIFQIKPVEITVKIEMGQNLSDNKRQELIKHLQERNTEIDRKTISEIKNYASQD